LDWSKPAWANSCVLTIKFIINFAPQHRLFILLGRPSPCYLAPLHSPDIAVPPHTFQAPRTAPQATLYQPHTSAFHSSIPLPNFPQASPLSSQSLCPPSATAHSPPACPPNIMYDQSPPRGGRFSRPLPFQTPSSKHGEQDGLQRSPSGARRRIARHIVSFLPPHSGVSPARVHNGT
jgi:hypothetical protein